MRKTTINVTKLLDEQVSRLFELTNHRNFSDVIKAAVYNYLRMAESSGVYAPIYTLDKIYVECEAAEAAVDVFQDVEGGPFYYKLRKARDFNELLNQPFYVEIESEDLIYPRAIYDYEEVKPVKDSDSWKFFEMVGITPDNWKPKYFQRAGLAATPQQGFDV